MEVNDNRTKVTKKEGQFKIFYKKLKKIKNIEVIIGVFILAIILLIYANSITKEKEKETESDTTTSAYLETEEKLEDILSNIEGAGQVKVMITYDGTSKLVTADTINSTTSTKTDNSGGSSYTTTDTTETTTPVLLDSEAVIVKELNPEIIGVIVVAEGASDIAVRLELLRVTATALNIDESLISISAGSFK